MTSELGRSSVEGNGNPLQYSGLENPMDRVPWTEFHGQRSLVNYSPWGHKESDTTLQLTHTYKGHVMYSYIPKW